jgi:hypothetical protein
MEKGTVTYVYFLQLENGNGKLQFVCCKQKIEDCFPWSANDKQLSTIAVSANVPIYDYY